MRKSYRSLFLVLSLIIIVGGVYFQLSDPIHRKILTLLTKTTDRQKNDEILRADLHSKSNPNPDLTVDEQTGLSRSVLVLDTTQGPVRIKLFSHDAPITVQRIVELVKGGFYDGLIFHRVEENFIIQTGDPTAAGHGGSGQNLPPEFNSRPHIMGTVSLARGESPDSGDSQFFIALGRFPQLDGKFTVFGQVIEGAQVIKRITKEDRIRVAYFL